MNPNKLYDSNFNHKIDLRYLGEIKDFLLKKQGWIYIAQANENDMLKIGRTSKHPIERAKTLSSTGVFHNYEIIFSLKVFNQFFVEKNVHERLKKFRVKKEFFLINRDTAIKIIEDEYLKEQALLSRFFNISMIKDDIELLPYSLI